MSTLTKVDGLLQSWDQALGTPGAPAIPAVFAKVRLVARGENLVFEQKPSKTLLERMFKKTPKEESFTSNLRTIRELFSSIKDPTREERDKLIALEMLLNGMGRYVFARKSEKSLFGTPKLPDYQIHAFCPTNTLVAPDTITGGLRNSTYKLCWLNVTLKYLAGCTLYDSILTTREQNPELEKVRVRLYHVIDALRKNWAQSVIDSLHQELIETLSKSPDFKRFFDIQEDADEFIRALSDRFSHKPTEYIEFIQVYSSADGLQKTAACPPKQHTHNIQIQPTCDETADIAQVLERPDDAEQITEYIINGKTVQNAPPRNFTKKTHFTHLPEHLEITRRQDIFGYNPLEQHGDLKNPKIKFHDDGTVTLTEYEPVTTQEYTFSARPKIRRTYRAIAGIERCLTKQITYGHFIAHTRAKDGTITTHNDTLTQPNRSETVWENCYWLYLVCIKQEHL